MLLTDNLGVPFAILRPHQKHHPGDGLRQGREPVSKVVVATCPAF